MKEGKFGPQEAISVVTFAICSKVFFSSHAFFIKSVGSAAWESVIIEILTAFIEFTIIYLLLKRFPEKNIVEIYNISLGPILGFIFSTIFAAFLLFNASVTIREFVEILRTYSYFQTSSNLMAAIFILAVVIASVLGLESIARMAKFFAHSILVVFFVVIILVVRYFNFRNIFPILGFGINETVIQGLMRSSIFGEVSILAVFTQSLQGIKNIKKAGYLSITLSAVILLCNIFAFTMLYPYFVLKEFTSPMYETIKMIKYGYFFQRLDPIILFFWTISTLIAEAVLFYCSISIICKIFKLNDSRPIILPLAILFFSIVMTPKSLPDLTLNIVKPLREYGWTIFFGFPFVALIISIIRKKKVYKLND